MRCCLILFLALLQGYSVNAQPVEWDRDIGGIIDAVVGSTIGPDEPGASVMVMRGADILATRAYGLADLERGVANTPETRFMVASVSKQFTAFGLALLDAEGKLSVDDDIRTVIPEMPEYEKPITFRHLITHTSGLRDSFILLGMAGWREDDVIRGEHIQQLAFQQRALNFSPGAEYSYSNTGYVLIAEAIKRLTGSPFDVWMHNEVFEPLGMADSHFMVDHRAIIPHRAQGYEPEQAGGFHLALNGHTSVGETGLYTTVLDLAKWVRNFRSPRVGQGRALALMNERGVLTTGDTLDYAFGQSIWTFAGHAAISHSGYHRGFRSYLIRFPESDFAVAVLVNRVDLSPADLGQEIARRLVEPGRDSLSTYIGTYRSEELDTRWRIVQTGGSLELRHTRHDPIPLRWEGPDVFSSDAEFFERLEFSRDHGRIVSFTGSTSRVRAMRFKRES